MEEKKKGEIQNEADTSKPKSQEKLNEFPKEIDINVIILKLLIKSEINLE